MFGWQMPACWDSRLVGEGSVVPVQPHRARLDCADVGSGVYAECGDAWVVECARPPCAACAVVESGCDDGAAA